MNVFKTTLLSKQVITFLKDLYQIEEFLLSDIRNATIYFWCTTQNHVTSKTSTIIDPLWKLKVPYFHMEDPEILVSVP